MTNLFFFLSFLLLLFFFLYSLVSYKQVARHQFLVFFSFTLSLGFLPNGVDGFYKAILWLEFPLSPDHVKRRPFSSLTKLGNDFLGFVLFGGKTPSLPRLFLICVKTFAPSRLVLHCCWSSKTRRSPAPLPVFIVVLAFLHYNPTVVDGLNTYLSF